MGSFLSPYLNTCLFSPRPNALCHCLSYAIEVFDDGESNERRTILSFLSEHVKTASQKPPGVFSFWLFSTIFRMKSQMVRRSFDSLCYFE